MKNIICYDQEDGMPRSYLLTEGGRMYLCDQGEAIDEIINTTDLVFLGETSLFGKLSIRHAAECLGVLTDNICDNHQRAMDAAVRRLKKWFDFVVVDEIRLLVTIKRDGNFKRLLINDLDTDDCYVNSGNFDDSDYASRWARRFVNALKDLYGDSAVKVTWKIQQD